MTTYIIETATASNRRTLGDVSTIEEARLNCAIAMSKAMDEGGPHFAFAIDDSGHYVVALERTEDGRILDHLSGGR
jgi:hypothetical protein